MEPRNESSKGGSFAKRRSHGFTLTEILVVIAIIVALGAVSYPLILRQMHQADETKARVMARDLHTAIDTYLDDNHGFFPVSASSSIDIKGDGDWMLFSSSDTGAAVVRAIVGKPLDSEVMNNQKGKVYIEIAKAADRGHGLTHDQNYQVTGLRDPWGEEYRFYCDFDLDGQVDSADMNLMWHNPMRTLKTVHQGRVFIGCLGRTGDFKHGLFSIGLN